MEMWNHLRSLIFYILLGKLVGYSYWYNSDYSQITFSTNHPFSDDFVVEIFNKYCSITIDLTRSELHISKSFHGLNNCGSIKFINGIFHLLSLELKFSNINLALPDQMYRFVLYNKHNKKTDWGSFISPPKPPNQVRNLTCVAKSDSNSISLKLSWKIPKIPGGQMIKYAIYLTSLANSKCVVTWIASCGSISRSGNKNKVGNGGSRKCTENPSLLEPFSSSATQYIYYLASSKINPITKYTIYVQPGNRWGWGPPIGILLSSPQLKPDAPKFLKFSSEFPKSKLILQLNPPLNPNGIISQYRVLLTSIGLNGCILWIYDCPSCRSNKTSIKNDLSAINCDKKEINISINNTSIDTIIIETINTVFIRPYHLYELRAHGNNGWGWGDILTQNIITSEYKSNAAQIKNITSVFPNNKLQATIIPPTIPNGEISQYLIVIKTANDDKCVNIWSIKCTDCLIKNVGLNGNHSIIESNGCSGAPILGFIFRSSVNPLILKSSNRNSVEPYTKYKIQIQSGNKWGWGVMSKYFIFKTPQFKPEPPKFVRVASDFPNSKWLIYLSHPTNPNGLISQYVIAVFRKKSSDCHFFIYDQSLNRATGNLGSNSKILTGCIYNGERIGFSNSNMDNILLPYKNVAFIKPHMEYILKAQANNGWGWGEMLVTTFSTPEYKSGAPPISSIESKFPNHNIQIKFTKPPNPNGQIIQYLVFMRSSNSTLCAKWHFLCSNCPKKTKEDSGQKIVIGGCKKVLQFEESFNFEKSSFNVASNNIEYISIYTDYKIQIQAANNWGWGDITTKEFTTAQYKPNSPTLAEISSEFPKTKLTIQLNPSTNPNGQISQYVISLFNKQLARCYFWIYDCYSCRSSSGNLGANSKILTGCITGGTRIGLPNSEMKNISLILKDASFIKPSMKYILKAQANNGWGWGDVLTTSFDTPEYKSSAPIFKEISSEFPDNKLKGTIISPTTPNGEIYEYLIVIKTAEDNKCANVWSINCIDCIETNIGTNGGRSIVNKSNCFQIPSLDFKFEKLMEIITLSTGRSESVDAYKTYDIQIQAGNKWGWGEPSKSVIFTTAQYISGHPNNVHSMSPFHEHKFAILWTPPSRPNGEIVEYSIAVATEDKSQCLDFWILQCNDCSDKKIGKKGQSLLNKFKNCLILNTKIYDLNRAEFYFITNSTNIKENKKYTILIQARNGWGWGHFEESKFIVEQNGLKGKLDISMVVFYASIICGVVSFNFVMAILILLFKKKIICKKQDHEIVIDSDDEIDSDEDNYLYETNAL